MSFSGKSCEMKFLYFLKTRCIVKWSGALAVRAYFLVSGCTGGWVQYISTPVKRSLSRMPSAPRKKSKKGKRDDGYASA